MGSRDWGDRLASSSGMVVVSAVEEEDEDEVEEDAVELAYRQVERQVWIVPPALLLLPPLADLNLRMLDSIMNDDGCGGWMQWMR